MCQRFWNYKNDGREIGIIVRRGRLEDTDTCYFKVGMLHVHLLAPFNNEMDVLVLESFEFDRCSLFKWDLAKVVGGDVKLKKGAVEFSLDFRF